MSAPTEVMRAFFSYSRHDSDFALKLAKHLREHGGAVWLDQLDINPGERWDSAVEQAVANCPRMLLILSPDSVGSTNVMDEVSFALEQRKVVIPVLYKDCNIPFRLRRVQYVDARTDYEGGLRELLSVLGASSAHESTEKPLSAAAAAAAVAGPEVAQITEKADQAQVEREQVRAAHITKEREEFEAARERERIGQERVQREPADEPRIPDQTEDVAAKAATDSLANRAALAGVNNEPKTHSSRKLLIGAALGVVVVLGIVMSLMRSRTGEQRTHLPAKVPAVQVEKVPEQSAREEKRTSELNRITEWLTQFVRVSQGPDVDALRPYFADVVSPYYSLPSADWPAISKDKTMYFSRFPTIQYSLVGPEFKQTSGGAELNFDLAYDNIRSDGHRAAGTSHLTVTAVRQGGAWKIAGIREQRVSQ